MVDLFRRHNGAPSPLPVVTYDDENNAFTPPYAEDDLARLGFVMAPPRPADTDTQTVEWDADAEMWIMVDRPPAPPPLPEPEPGPVVLFPADLWRRATDAEAEAIDAAMEAQPLRIRRLFDAAQTYQSDDPLWPLLTDAAVQLFGEARAGELLAPS